MISRNHSSLPTLTGSNCLLCGCNMHRCRNDYLMYAYRQIISLPIAKLILDKKLWNTKLKLFEWMNALPGSMP
jgi:hypothetical protein